MNLGGDKIKGGEGGGMEIKGLKEGVGRGGNEGDMRMGS